MRLAAIERLQQAVRRLRDALTPRRKLRPDGALPVPRIFLGPF